MLFQWILGVIEGGGYFGIFFLMILENVFPPIPSEVIIPLAGFVAAQGKLHIVGVFLAATLGSVVGSIPWYLLGRLFGIDRLKLLSEKFGRIVTLNAHDIDIAERWFTKYGHLAVVFGRLMPAIRTLISVPAGLAAMSFTRFIAYSFVGAGVWTGVLLAFGYILEDQYEKISPIVDAGTYVVVGLCVLVYVYRVITYKK